MKRKLGLLLKLSLLLFLLFPLSGFRVLPRIATWNIDPGAPTLWVQFSHRPSLGSNDLASDDPLAGASLTFTSATQSVFNDFNNVSTSYARLRDIATAPPTGAESSTERLIEITFVDTQFTIAGVTRRRVRNKQVIGCNIDISNRAVESARTFLYTLTHEIGHCLGLDHPQETVNSVMSYFADRSRVRLQTDDKMGLTFLFPVNADMAKENPTFGLSCAPR